jgi:multicomponent Na+:H+ antiporter subunit E
MTLRRLPHLAWLAAVWVALWGDVTAGNVLAGAAVAVGLVSVFPGARPGPAAPVRPVALLRFAGFFVWQVIKANAILSWEIVTPKRHLEAGIVKMELHTQSDAVITLIANAITLTPGTLALTVHRGGPLPILYVHILHLHDVESVRCDLAQTERLAIAAFGGATTQQRTSAVRR